MSEHPLIAPSHLGVAAFVALFWVAGITLVDAHMGLGLVLCSLGVIITVWIYSGEFRTIKLKQPRTWPWIGLLFIFIELSVPSYLLSVRAEDRLVGLTNAGTSTNQTDGNNSGPTSNSLFFQGPIIVSNKNECPPGHLILSGNVAAGNGKGFSFPADAPICLVKNEAYQNGTGYEVRPAGQ